MNNTHDFFDVLYSTMANHSVPPMDNESNDNDAIILDGGTHKVVLTQQEVDGMAEYINKAMYNSTDLNELKNLCNLLMVLHTTGLVELTKEKIDMMELITNSNGNPMSLLANLLTSHP